MVFVAQYFGELPLLVYLNLNAAIEATEDTSGGMGFCFSHFQKFVEVMEIQAIIQNKL